MGVSFVARVPGLGGHSAQRSAYLVSRPPGRLDWSRERSRRKPHRGCCRFNAPAPRGCRLVHRLPSAGKTTIASLVGERLAERGHPVEVLDGDVVRTCPVGWGSPRPTGTRTSAASAMSPGSDRPWVTVLVSAISPYRAVRDEVRAAVERRRLCRGPRGRRPGDLPGPRRQGPVRRHARASCAVSPGSTIPTSHRRLPSWSSTPRRVARGVGGRCWPCSSAGRSRRWPGAEHDRRVAAGP